MTPEFLPWIVTLYCAVCRCYYDNRVAGKAEVSHIWKLFFVHVSFPVIRRIFVVNIEGICQKSSGEN